MSTYTCKLWLLIVEFILQDPTYFLFFFALMQGKKGTGKSRDLQKKSRDFWTSLVPGPQDHGTFKVSRTCPVPSRPGKSREGPGTGRDRTGPRNLEGPVVLWSRD